MTLLIILGLGTIRQAEGLNSQMTVKLTYSPVVHQRDVRRSVSADGFPPPPLLLSP